MSCIALSNLAQINACFQNDGYSQEEIYSAVSSYNDLLPTVYVFDGGKVRSQVTGDSYFISDFLHTDDYLNWLGEASMGILGCTDSNADNFCSESTVDNGGCQYSGCTDEEALNYDDEATVDDGSCNMPIYGCTNSESFNYNPNANTNDGSCIAVDGGCTDSEASNYDSGANTDDGSCQYEILGCTDSNADNYNTDANTDDGSCYKMGCTDPDAENFDFSATTDDGSCSFGGGSKKDKNWMLYGGMGLLILLLLSQKKK